MRSDQQRSRHNMNQFSNLLDEHSPVESAATQLVRRFHRRSRYLVLAIGIGAERTGDESTRWIFVVSKQLPSGRLTDAEWFLIQFGINERSIRFQPCASRAELLRAFRSIVTPRQMRTQRQPQARSTHDALTTDHQQPRPRCSSTSEKAEAPKSHHGHICSGNDYGSQRRYVMRT